MSLTGNSKHAHDSWLACDSHKKIFDTAATSHSRLSWLESSNSRVGISRETSSRILHPLLSSVSAWVASSESWTSVMLHLSGTVCMHACMYVCMCIVPVTSSVCFFWMYPTLKDNRPLSLSPLLCSQHYINDHTIHYYPYTPFG